MATRMTAHCCTCGELKTACYQVSYSLKSIRKDFPALFNYVLGFRPGENSWLCRPCFSQLEKFAEFKKKALSLRKPDADKGCGDYSGERKRPISTPIHPAPKRMQLASSVEKLELSARSQEMTNPVSKQKLPFDEKFYSVAENREGTSVLKTVEREHNYSRTYFSTESSQEKGTEEEEQSELLCTDRKAIILELQDAFSHLSKKGCSIFYEKSASQLCNNHEQFQNILMEMKTKLPFLYELLDALTGDVGSKYATICTIYGMLIHSRNMQVSASQQLGSTASIKSRPDIQGNKGVSNMVFILNPQ